MEPENCNIIWHQGAHDEDARDAGKIKEKIVTI